MARPRDDVMAGAYRCAAQVSSRVWLDCYYGAAQPARAALNLPPAPASQVKLLDAPPSSGVPQDIEARDEVMTAAGGCGGIGDERAWLNCYYAAANPVRGLLGLPLTAGATPPPPAPMPVSAPAKPPLVQRSNPGFIGRVLGMPDLKVVSRMASYQFGGHDFTVTLENGQVWRQLDGDTASAHWRKEPGTYLVTITGGAFGTYNLSVKGDAGHYKVRRIS